MIYLLQGNTQSPEVTHAEIIEYTDALNVCFGSKVTHDTCNEQTVILHVEADVPPVDILACDHSFWWSPFYYIRERLVVEVDSRRHSIERFFPLHAIGHLL